MTVDETRLKKQLDFLLEIDKSKEIIRQTYLSSGSRKEGDAEHAWHMALMAFLLSEYANEPVDTARVVAMTLVHDLVEIDAGDTYAYDTVGNASKKEREQKAADRIFSILPQDQGKWMRDLWEEFEAMETPEARFANTLDKIQPIMLTDAQGGKSWKEHDVKEEMVMKRNERTGEGSEVLWAHFKQILEENTAKGNLRK